MLLRGSILAGAVALSAFCGSHEAKAQGVFTLSSPSFKDGERLAVKNAGNNKSNPNCVGENVSPCGPSLKRHCPRPGERIIDQIVRFRELGDKRSGDGRFEFSDIRRQLMKRTLCLQGAPRPVARQDGRRGRRTKSRRTGRRSQSNWRGGDRDHFRRVQ